MLLDPTATGSVKFETGSAAIRALYPDLPTVFIDCQAAKRRSPNPTLLAPL